MICLFARENRQICASGSGVERRLAKAKVAGSNPVSRSLLYPGNAVFMRVSGFFISLILLHLLYLLGQMLLRQMLPFLLHCHFCACLLPKLENQ